MEINSKRIDQLPVAGAANTYDLLPIYQNETTKQITKERFLKEINSRGINKYFILVDGVYIETMGNIYMLELLILVKLWKALIYGLIPVSLFNRRI